MNEQQKETVQNCAERSLQGTIVFPEVVRRLAGAGVERYHVDYSRQEGTYYLADGSSMVVPMPHPPHPVAETFSQASVEAAIRESQRGEIVYTEFVRKTMGAGCVGYFVQIAGRRALYFGRNGDLHLEPFPPI